MLISQKFLYLQENQKRNSYSSASRYVESKAVYGELVDKLDTLRRRWDVVSKIDDKRKIVQSWNDKPKENSGGP